MSVQSIIQCQAFHEGLPDGRATGLLHIHSDHIRFEVGDNRGQLALRGLNLELGGASNRLVFLTHPMWRGWSFYTSNRAILKHPTIANHPALRAQVTEAHNKRRVSLALFVAVVIAVVAIPFFLLTRVDSATEWMAGRLPVTWENRLGQAALAQYRQNHALLDQEQTGPMLAPLVAPLLAALEQHPYSFQFYIARDAAVNAFALPGGYVVINTGLIDETDSAEELLGVVGHELAHVTQQHGVRSLIGSAGIYLLFSAVFGDAGGAVGAGANLAPYLLNQSYSRKFEAEADVYSYELLVRAQVDPAGLSRFFTRLMEQEGQTDAADVTLSPALQKALDYLGTHPTSATRLRHLESLAAGGADVEYLDLSESFAHLKRELLNTSPTPTE